jgi:hypothetical protein
MNQKDEQRITEYDEYTQEPVWINCGAKNSCEGKFAVLSLKVETLGSGVTYRYKCTTCGRPFSIQMGHGFK